MDWKVRQASIADVDHLALVGSATFLETFAGVLDGAAIVAHCQREHTPAAYRRYLASGAQVWLVEANSGQASVGFSLLGNTDLPGSMSDGSDIELKRIYTLSGFHGHGLGAQLIERAVDHADQRGARRLLLGVDAGASGRDHGCQRKTVNTVENGVSFLPPL